MKCWIVLRIFPETSPKNGRVTRHDEALSIERSWKKYLTLWILGNTQSSAKMRNSVNWVMHGVFFPVAVQFCVSSVFGKEGASADRVGVTVPFRTAAFVRMFHDFFASHGKSCFSLLCLLHHRLRQNLKVVDHFPRNEIRLWKSLVLRCSKQAMGAVYLSTDGWRKTLGLVPWPKFAASLAVRSFSFWPWRAAWGPFWPGNEWRNIVSSEPTSSHSVDWWPRLWGLTCLKDKSMWNWKSKESWCPKVAVFGTLEQMMAFGTPIHFISSIIWTIPRCCLSPKPKSSCPCAGAMPPRIRPLQAGWNCITWPWRRAPTSWNIVSFLPLWRAL